MANVTLGFERGTAFAGWIIGLGQLIAELGELAERTGRADAALRGELGHFAAEVDALWALVKLYACEASEGAPGLGGSAVKLRYSELYQRISETGMRLLGRAALARSDVAGRPCERILTQAMHSLSLTIAAGTSQIQRNIIAERILGLPKEAR